jgi:hypothetical protein
MPPLVNSSKIARALYARMLGERLGEVFRKYILGEISPAQLESASRLTLLVIRLMAEEPKQWTGDEVTFA